jgi:hypothetical protein
MNRISALRGEENLDFWNNRGWKGRLPKISFSKIQNFCMFNIPQLVLSICIDDFKVCCNVFFSWDG